MSALIKSVLTAFLLVPTIEQRASRLPISNQQCLFSDRKPWRTTRTKINRGCLLLCINSWVKASILPQSFRCWLFLKVQSANKEFSRTLAQGCPGEGNNVLLLNDIRVSATIWWLVIYNCVDRDFPGAAERWRIKNPEKFRNKRGIF